MVTRSPWHFVKRIAEQQRIVISPLCRSVLQRCSHSQPTKFKILDAAVDINSPTYHTNYAHNYALVNKLKTALAKATSGGDAKAVERHTVKNKKLLVSDRLALLFDDAAEVLELSPLSGLGMKYGDIPRAGIISVIGRIHGIYCMVVANDATIKAGTMYPISVKKQLRSLEVALQNGIPCVWIVDSGGAFLPMQAEIFPDRMHGGRTFYNEALLNAMNIPQLAIVCGSCTAGAAYVPTMAQEAIIVDKIGTIFLAGPPLVRAALGEVVSPDDLGGARLHCSVSGCTDYYAKTEQEAFEMGRASVAAFNFDPVPVRTNIEEPLYDPDELLGVIPADKHGRLNMHQVIARIVDGSQFHEFKAAYGKSVVAGFCSVSGHLVGVVGNNGVMTSDAAEKASHFVQLCSQRDVPIIFLQNVTLPSEDAGNSSLQQAAVNGELLRSQAKLMSSVACAGVPIITVVVGNSYGFESYMMGGRSFSPRFLFCWPNARVCITEPQQLADTLLKEQLSRETGRPTDEQVEELRREVSNKCDVQSTAFYSSSQGWDDGVILPQDTRRVLAQCLNIVGQNPKLRSSSVNNKGVIRM